MNLLLAWSYVSMGIQWTLTVASVASNGITLLALRKRHGLRTVLGGTTSMLVGCLSFVYLLDGIGMPLVAFSGPLKFDWFFNATSSTISPALICGFAMSQTMTLYNIATWYLTAIAVVRFVLVWWPQTGARQLKTTAALVLLCVLPVLVGLLGTFGAVAVHAVRFDNYKGMY